MHRHTVLILLGWLLGLGSAARAGEDVWTGGGPDGGWVTTLLRPYGPLGDLFAGTYAGGVFGSADGGRTWTDLTSNLPGTVVWDLQYGAGENPTMYAATGDAGIASSTPPFTRWTPINTGLNGGEPVGVQSVVVHPGSPEVITVATDSGVATSDRWGGFWPLSLQWLSGFTFVDVEVHHLAPSRIHALQSTDLYVTDDFGAHVFRYGQESGLPADLLEDLELWPTSLDTFFVVSRTRGVYRAIPGPRFYYSGPAEKPAQNPILYTMKAVPLTRELLLAGEEGLYVSADIGRSWRKLDDGLGTAHQEIWSILVDDARSLRLVLGSFRYGILRSDVAGERWQESNEGLRAALVNGVWARGDAILAATAHGRIFWSDDAGRTWQDRTGTLDILQARDAIVLESGRWLVSSTQGLWLTDDAGQTWREPTTPPAERIARTLLHPPWWPAAHLLLGTLHGVYHSTDAGETWTRLSNVPADVSYLAMGAAPVDQTLWLGAAGDALYRGSLAEGFTRVPSAPGQSRAYFDLAFPDGSSQSVLVATASGLFRFQAQEGGGYASEDIGQGLPTASFESGPDVSGVEAFDGDIVVGLYERGVYRSEDGGATWTDFGAGLRMPHVQELTRVEGTAARLCVATWGAGVYQRTLPDAVPVLVDSPVLTQVGQTIVVKLRAAAAVDAELWRAVPGAPASRRFQGRIDGALRFVDDLSAQSLVEGAVVRYRVEVRTAEGMVQTTGAEIVWTGGDAPGALRDRLLPAWPNPFNPRTNLAFELQRAADVQLAIFDVRGRRVRTLWDGRREAGRHELVWRGTDERDTLVPSGVYLVQLRVDGTRIAHQRITLVR